MDVCPRRKVQWARTAYVSSHARTHEETAARKMMLTLVDDGDVKEEVMCMLTSTCHIRMQRLLQHCALADHASKFSGMEVGLVTNG